MYFIIVPLQEDMRRVVALRVEIEEKKGFLACGDGFILKSYWRKDQPYAQNAGRACFDMSDLGTA